MTPDTLATLLRELAREYADTRWGRSLATDAARIERLNGRFVGEWVR